MTRALAYGMLCAFGAVSIALIAARPDWVGDSNGFLKNFVNHEFVNVLGVILAITLASVAQIHLEFNRIEEVHKIKDALERSRSELRSTAYWLVVLFIAGVAVVTIKPIATGSVTAGAPAVPTTEGFFNMLSLFILLWHVLMLVSLLQTVFAIEPEFFDGDDQPKG